MATFSASLSNLPQSRDCSYYVSRPILALPPLGLQEHADLSAHDFEYSPDLWCQPRLANFNCAWTWRLLGITSAITCAAIIGNVTLLTCGISLPSIQLDHSSPINWNACGLVTAKGQARDLKFSAVSGTRKVCSSVQTVHKTCTFCIQNKPEGGGGQKVKKKFQCVIPLNTKVFFLRWRPG